MQLSIKESAFYSYQQNPIHNIPCNKIQESKQDCKEKEGVKEMNNKIY